MKAPDLPARCNSWVIVDRQTHVPVMETYSHAIADAAAEKANLEVVPTLEWLQRFNRAVRMDGGIQSTKAQLDAARTNKNPDLC